MFSKYFVNIKQGLRSEWGNKILRLVDYLSIVRSQNVGHIKKNFKCLSAAYSQQSTGKHFVSN